MELIVFHKAINIKLLGLEKANQLDYILFHIILDDLRSFDNKTTLLEIYKKLVKTLEEIANKSSNQL
ncbi:hypothetical protein CQA44_01300 [Helicobacter sp. MIT 14-3879]|nr:hypothetical protein CQA44_01300 [Helicobacter sp. MIT 14-3879]